MDKKVSVHPTKTAHIGKASFDKEPQLNKEETDQKVESIYPVQFLGFLSERLLVTVKRLLVIYGVPEAAVTALDNLQFIEILSHSDPEKWAPCGRATYDVDTRITVEEMIWQIEEMDKLQSEKLQTNYDEIAKSDSKILRDEFGWRS